MKAVIVLFAVLACAFAQLSVSGSVRNEFGGDLVLKGYSLTQGSWIQKPVASIATSTTYTGGIFSAQGAEVEGWVQYQSSDGYAKAQFFFQNVPGNNSTYTAKVGPSPYIGGVGPITGSTSVTVDYWVHQMCESRNGGGDCN